MVYSLDDAADVIGGECVAAIAKFGASMTKGRPDSDALN